MRKIWMKKIIKFNFFKIKIKKHNFIQYKIINNKLLIKLNYSMIYKIVCLINKNHNKN